LWQLDVIGGFLLADGSHAKALTGIDDHSRFCVSARDDRIRAGPARTRPALERLAFSVMVSLRVRTR
jgi:hypothetical protein